MSAKPPAPDELLKLLVVIAKRVAKQRSVPANRNVYRAETTVDVLPVVRMLIEKLEEETEILDYSDLEEE